MSYRYVDGPPKLTPRAWEVLEWAHSDPEGRLLLTRAPRGRNRIEGRADVVNDGTFRALIAREWLDLHHGGAGWGVDEWVKITPAGRYAHMAHTAGFTDEAVADVVEACIREGHPPPAEVDA